VLPDADRLAPKQAQMAQQAQQAQMVQMVPALPTPHLTELRVQRRSE